jgi:hypothetical protein
VPAETDSKVSLPGERRREDEQCSEGYKLLKRFVDAQTAESIAE